jgi:hypothetical protein
MVESINTAVLMSYACMTMPVWSKVAIFFQQL